MLVRINESDMRPRYKEHAKSQINIGKNTIKTFQLKGAFKI